ncbi:MAG: GTPase [Thaumarchaeota archaeon]|nr:MAG: GTPase [Nitrososphaerota archaeon]
MIRGLNVIFIGPAGCGKTSLTNVFGEWCERELGMTIAYVNLDPGVLNLPYKPDYDIRELVTVHRLMQEEGLGPNGAMIRASEIMDENIESIVEKISSFDADLRLIDTPGQMELFLFRPMGPRLSEAISKDSPSITVYISDPSLASNPSGLAISLSMALITWLRLSTPTVPVINKIDVFEEGSEKLLTDPSTLKESLLREEGLIADLAAEYMNLVEDLFKSMRIVKVSAKTGEGMPALYDIIHESLCECGDLS